MRRPSQPPSKSFALTSGEVVSNAGVEARLYRKVLISEAPGTAAQTVRPVRQTGLAMRGQQRTHGQRRSGGGPCFCDIKYFEIGGVYMKNPNIDLLGQVNLLRALQEAGIINEQELKRIAVRLAVKNGASIVIW